MEAAPGFEPGYRAYGDRLSIIPAQGHFSRARKGALGPSWGEPRGRSWSIVARSFRCPIRVAPTGLRRRPCKASAGSGIDERLGWEEFVRSYTIVAGADEGGGYFVTVPAFPGCFTRGSTIEECQARAVEAIEVHIAGLVIDGQPIPEELGKPQLRSVTVGR